MSTSLLPELRVALDPRRFAGQWFELARTTGIPFEPDGITNVRAEYVWRGAGEMLVHNTALAPATAARAGTDDDDQRKTIEWHGSARPINSFNTRFALTVTHPAGGRPFHSVYRVLDADTTDYAWAVMAGDESNKWVWILARERLQTREWWISLLERLEQHFGVDYRRLAYTRHDDDGTAALPVAASASGPPTVQQRADGSYVVHIV